MAPGTTRWSGACFAYALGRRSYASENPTSLSPVRHAGSVALLAFLVLHRLAEAEAFAVHLEDLAAVRQPIQQRRRHPLALEDLAPFAERQVARHQQAAPLVAI